MNPHPPSSSHASHSDRQQACWSQSLGDFAEDAVAFWLESCGYHVLERNYHCRKGELDIIAEQGEQLLVVEVRALSGRRVSPGRALATITWAKQKRLVAALRHYLMNANKDDKDIRLEGAGLIVMSDGSLWMERQPLMLG